MHCEAWTVKRNNGFVHYFHLPYTFENHYTCCLKSPVHEIAMHICQTLGEQAFQLLNSCTCSICLDMCLVFLESVITQRKVSDRLRSPPQFTSTYKSGNIDHCCTNVTVCLYLPTHNQGTEYRLVVVPHLSFFLHTITITVIYVVRAWGEVWGRKVLAMTEQMITCREFSSHVWDSPPESEKYVCFCRLADTI